MSDLPEFPEHCREDVSDKEFFSRESSPDDFLDPVEPEDD